MNSKNRSLLSIFLGVLIFSQVAIYLIFISFDIYFSTIEYVKGTEIVVLLFCLFATYLTWKSATASESKPLGITVKSLTIIILIATATLVITGVRADKRIEKIKLFHLENIYGKEEIEKYKKAINKLENSVETENEIKPEKNEVADPMKEITNKVENAINDEVQMNAEEIKNRFKEIIKKDENK